MATMNEGLRNKRGSLTDAVIGELISRMNNGVYAPGQKLPTEQELCSEFGVSRTVVRESVASLRLGGRLTSRQGLGVFVTERETTKLNFFIGQIDDIRSAMRVLELRSAVEIEAAALAAVRRTPTAMADITAAFDRLASMQNVDINEEAQADFDFHLAIAQATNNSHFPQLLIAMGHDISLDLRMKHQQSLQDPESYHKKISREHGAILSAIMQGDVKAARTNMRRHLEESLLRYRHLIDGNANAANPEP
jgi:GntR family transcriptional regulator, transcriptional repressor for pyruvate dehydrogenase complex